MSTTTLELVKEWASLVRWRDGEGGKIPGDETSPKLTHLLDRIRRREMMAIEDQAAKFSVTTGTITTSTSSNSYTTLTGLWDEQIIAIRFSGATDPKMILRQVDWETMTQEYRRFDDSGYTGTPRAYTINPSTRGIQFWPYPSAVHTLTVTYVALPATYAIAADPVWFFETEDMAASDTIQATDSRFLKAFFDRSRNVTLTPSGTRAGTSTITITGTLAGATVTQVFTLLTGSVTTMQTGATVFDDIGSIAADAANADTVTISLGIGSTFEATSGRSYRTTSLIPDGHALEIAPKGAAADHCREIGEMGEAADWEAGFAEAVLRMKGKYATNPDADISFFRRGFSPARY